MASAQDAENLRKLTIPQLKALCKERRITGYSKLTKAALIEKLTHAAGTQSNTNARPTASQSSQPPPVAKSKNSPETHHKGQEAETPSAVTNQVAAPNGHALQSGNRSVSTLGVDNIVSIHPLRVSQEDQSQNAKHDAPQSLNLQHTSVVSSSESPFTTGHTVSRNPKQNPESTQQVTSAAKRKPSIPHLVSAPPPKKQRLTYSPRTTPSRVNTQNQASSRTFKIPQLPEKVISENADLAPDALSMANRSMLEPASTLGSTPANLATASRFKPLMIQKLYEISISSSVSKSNTGARISPSVDLDFPFSLPVSLAAISLPPSVSHRKYVQRYAIFLSGLQEEEIRVCIQVSRMFRYAVYLSAYYKLQRYFPGRRLSHIAQEYSPAMTNMWPYLRQRQTEVSSRRMWYQASFLANAIKNPHPLSGYLWTSPDDDRQATIAIRFLLTRLWFYVSIGDGRARLSWTCGTVVDAQELIKNDIWSIKVSYQSEQPPRLEWYYVLEATCEVVAQFSASSQEPCQSSPANHPYPLRADWSKYIADRLLPSMPHDSPPPSLLDHLTWTNHEEYYRGISKLWLRRIDAEGEFGLVKRRMAERYILACVVGNSVSGRWMSSTEMSQEFSGLPSQVPFTRPAAKSSHVHLFLPAHHHVESLHFTTSKGVPLHPAIAVIQTPGREYYILRDNGMQVGCEDEGIASVWMDIIGCTSIGLPVQ